MSKPLRLPIIVNKKNGQLSTYINQNKIPQAIVDDVKRQPTALRYLVAKDWSIEND
jgi:hypothetical protein